MVYRDGSVKQMIRVEGGREMMAAHVYVLLLGGEEHPGVSKHAGEPEGGVHRPNEARQAALIDHPVRLPALLTADRLQDTLQEDLASGTEKSL